MSEEEIPEIIYQWSIALYGCELWAIGKAGKQP